MPSQLEGIQSEQAEIASHIRPFRKLVNKADKAVKATKRVTEQIDRYASEPEVMGAEVALHKDRAWRWRIIAALLAIIFAGEFLSGSHVASALLPGWPDMVCSSLFAILILGITVTVKWFTNRSETTIQNALSGLMQGQERIQRQLHRKPWLCRSAKAIILLMVAVYYAAIFSSRVEMARIKFENQITEDNTAKISAAPIIVSNPPSGNSEAGMTTAQREEAKARALKTTAGSLGLFAILWIAHFVVLTMDVRDMGGDTHLRKFTLGRAAAKSQRLRDKEESQLRRLAITLRDAPSDRIRQALIVEVQPVAARLDELAARDGNEPPSNEPPPSAWGAPMPAIAPPIAPAPAIATSAAAHTDAYDDIFPRSQPV